MKDYSAYHSKALKLLNKDSFYEELYSLFCRGLSSYDPTCEEVAIMFGTRYILEKTRLEKKEVIEVSTHFFALVSSDFTDDMDFSSEQWNFISELTLSFQDKLSIKVLNTVLNILMERKKLVF